MVQIFVAFSEYLDFTSIMWASMYIKSKLRMMSSVFSLLISFFFVNDKVTKSLRFGKV